MPDAADLLARLEALEAELQGERTRRHLAEELARCYSEAAFEAIILHEQGVVIEVNQAAVEIRGGTREEYLGLPISALVAPESWADVAARQAEGSSGPYEITAVRHDGSTVPMEARARNIEFMGRLVRVVAGHDLTARKSAEARLAESEQRYRAIAENSSDIIVVSDLTGMPSFVSSACRRILGYEPDELLAMNWMDNIHPEDLVSLTAPSPPRQPGDAPSESEFRAKTKDGHYVWLASTTTRLSDPQTGAVVALQSSIRDITERKRLADQQLELETMKRSAELKDQFLGIVSHELRTPLTAIRGAASLVDDNRIGTINEQQAGFLGIIRSHATRLSDLVDDLLDLSKIEAGKMTYERSSGDLATLAQRVVRDFANVFATKGIQLETDLARARAQFDPIRMTQVLTNLLSNASKFTSAEGRVRVRSYEYEGEARLEVIDTGVGIPADRRTDLFSKFYQVDGSATRRTGGTGLGLAICKAIVEEGHYGFISFDSTEGEGSTFTVHLPLLVGDQTTCAARVLLIDDEAEGNQVLADLLGRSGISATLSTNGYEGIAAAIKQVPDLIVVDLLMPHLDGFEVLERLKANPALRQVPIFVCTIVGSSDARDQALELGADGVFVKGETTYEAVATAIVARLAAELLVPMKQDEPSV